MHITPPRPRQRGVATVLITVVLLLAVALVVLYASRSALVEQRLSANEIRAKQALMAAQAGIDAALAHMNSGGIYQGDDIVEDPPVYTLDTFAVESMTNTDGKIVSYFRVAFVDPAAVAPAAPPIACPTKHTDGFDAILVPPSSATRLTTVAAVSCGWSDDDASVQRVVQLFEPGPTLAGTVSTPLVTGGATNLVEATTTVFNYFNDLTVWSGEGLGVGKGGGVGTCNAYVRDVSDAGGGHALPLDDFPFRDVTKSGSSTKEGHVCSTSGSTVGHDSVAFDTTLSTKSPDQFFEYFMGKSKDQYKESANWVGTDDGIAAAIEKGYQVLWVDATGAPAELPKILIGTREKPVILVIDGDLDIGASGAVGEVNGLTFVTGKVTGAANFNFYGSLIVAENYESTGTINIVYDPNVLTGVSKLGKAAKLNGSWRDW